MALVPFRRARLGGRLLSIARLGRFFHRAPIITEGLVAGVIHKPRELLPPGAGLFSDTGLPVFTPDAMLVGFFVLQQPEASGLDAEASCDSDDSDYFILPAEAVARATIRPVEKRGDEPDESTP